MALFDKTFIESTLTLSIICWYGNVTIRDKNALSRIVNMASKIVGVKFEQVFNKAIQIYQDTGHPFLHPLFYPSTECTQQEKIDPRIHFLLLYLTYLLKFYLGFTDSSFKADLFITTKVFSAYLSVL